MWMSGAASSASKSSKGWQDSAGREAGLFRVHEDPCPGFSPAWLAKKRHAPVDGVSFYFWQGTI